MEEKVTKILDEIGVSTGLKGYNYLKTAICMIVEDSDIINDVTRVLYPAVARKHTIIIGGKLQATTAGSVERAIRKAVEVAWDRGDAGALDSYFGAGSAFGGKAPTPKRFIATIADYVKSNR